VTYTGQEQGLHMRFSRTIKVFALSKIISDFHARTHLFDVVLWSQGQDKVDETPS
jgi:hypothetical protein